MEKQHGVGGGLWVRQDGGLPLLYPGQLFQDRHCGLLHPLQGPEIHRRTGSKDAQLSVFLRCNHSALWVSPLGNFWGFLSQYWTMLALGLPCCALGLGRCLCDHCFCDFPTLPGCSFIYHKAAALCLAFIPLPFPCPCTVTLLGSRGTFKNSFQLCVYPG